MQAPPDPFQLANAVAVAVFGATVGAVAGPYALIFVLSLVGAAVSAAARETATKSETAGIIASHVATALVTAIPLSMWAGQYVLGWQWIGGPAAFAIGYVGPVWFIDQFKTLLSKRFGGGDDARS